MSKDFLSDNLCIDINYDNYGISFNIYFYKEDNKYMLYVEKNNIFSAVKEVYVRLYPQTSIPCDPALEREDSATIVVTNKGKQDKEAVNLKNGILEYSFNYLEYFPHTHKIREDIIDYELSFWNPDFIKPPRLKHMIDHLKEYPYSRRAIINLWKDFEHEQLDLPAPCVTQVLFRVKGDYLEMHSHLRANNMSFLLFMDMQVMSGIHQIAASELKLKKGIYIHFVDSLHCYRKEADIMQKQYEYILHSKIWNKIK